MRNKMAHSLALCTVRIVVLFVFVWLDSTFPLAFVFICFCLFLYFLFLQFFIKFNESIYPHAFYACMYLFALCLFIESKWNTEWGGGCARGFLAVSNFPISFHFIVRFYFLGHIIIIREIVLANVAYRE